MVFWLRISRELPSVYWPSVPRISKTGSPHRLMTISGLSTMKLIMSVAAQSCTPDTDMLRSTWQAEVTVWSPAPRYFSLERNTPRTTSSRRMMETTRALITALLDLFRWKILPSMVYERLLELCKWSVRCSLVWLSLIRQLRRLAGIKVMMVTGMRLIYFYLYSIQLMHFRWSPQDGRSYR